MSAAAEAGFLAALAPELVPAFAALPSLGDRLAVWAALPEASLLTREDLFAGVARRIGEGDLAEPEAALGSFEIADLCLALACAKGAPRALEELDRRFGGEMDRAIAKSKSLGVSRDEFRQIIREKLFVAAPGQEPRIASYGGRAPLAGWLRVVCARAVIDLARRQDDLPAGDQGLLDRLPSRDDPELAALRARHAEALPVAFAAGLAALAPRQRNLLRQRYLHNVSAASLAQSYGVHRATLFEWLEAARGDLIKHTEKRLKGAVEQNLDSLLGLLGSELDLSIRRLLSSTVEDETDV